MNAGRSLRWIRSHGKQRVAVLQEEIHMIHHANELYWRHTKPSDADRAEYYRRAGSVGGDSARVGWTASEIIERPTARRFLGANQVIAYIYGGNANPSFNVGACPLPAGAWSSGTVNLVILIPAAAPTL